MRGMKSLSIAALIAAAIAGPAVAAGYGGPGSHGGSGGRGGYGWNGPHHYGFAPGWTNGRWVHGFNGARYGWWWTVGALSYLYAQPVYPYPSYLPYDSGYGGYYGADDEGSGYASSGYGELIQNNDPPSPYRYYCADPKGYYPQVPDCDDWQQIYLGSSANNEE